MKCVLLIAMTRCKIISALSTLCFAECKGHG